MKYGLFQWFLVVSLAVAISTVAIGFLVDRGTIERQPASCMAFGATLGVETRYMPDWGCWQRVQSGDWVRVK